MEVFLRATDSTCYTDRIIPNYSTARSFLGETRGDENAVS